MSRIHITYYESRGTKFVIEFDPRIEKFYGRRIDEETEDNGESENELSSYTINGLKILLGKSLRGKKVDIPFCEIDDMERKIVSKSIVGVHLGNDNLLVKIPGNKRTVQVWGSRLGSWFRPTTQEKKKMTELLKKEDSVQKEISDLHGRMTKRDGPKIEEELKKAGLLKRRDR